MGKFIIKQAKSGPMFNLKARNGEIIGTSEIYSSVDACKNGIASVQKNAPVQTGTGPGNMYPYPERREKRHSVPSRR